MPEWDFIEDKLLELSSRCYRSDEIVELSTLIIQPLESPVLFCTYM